MMLTHSRCWTLLKLNVRPQFVYQPMRLDDKVFGVVEISN